MAPEAFNSRLQACRPTTDAWATSAAISAKANGLHPGHVRTCSRGLALRAKRLRQNRFSERMRACTRRVGRASMSDTSKPAVAVMLSAVGFATGAPIVLQRAAATTASAEVASRARCQRRRRQAQSYAMVSRASVLIAISASLPAPFISAACGGDVSGSNAPPPSSVPMDESFTRLTNDQKAALCDWGSGLAGGYGVARRCSDGSCAFTYPDQATCVAAFPETGCSATVGQYESCAQALAKSQGCDLSSLPASCDSLEPSCSMTPPPPPAVCN